MMHDTTLARTTDVANVFPDRAGDPVNSFTHDELQQLDAGSWFSDEFAGEKIPTLHEVLEAAHPVVGVVIELKSPELSPGLVDVVVDELESDPRWDELADDGRLTAISFDLEAVHDFYEQRPAAESGHGRLDRFGSRRHVELGPVELLIAAASGQQLFVGAAFHDPAVLDHEDEVSRADRR
jgi:glycerophosphoryl diester phosphodiesterase